MITDVAYIWRQWNISNILINKFSILSTSASTGIARINGWATTNGIGSLVRNYNETALRGFLRGGGRGSGSYAGILSLIMGDSHGSAGGFGFRAVTPGS